MSSFGSNSRRVLAKLMPNPSIELRAKGCALCFITIFVATCSAAHPADVQVFLLNGSITDLAVDAGTNKSSIEVLPGEGASVVFRSHQWVNFGQHAHRYDTKPLRAMAGKAGRELVLQAQPDGRLYLLPPGTAKPMTPTPRQPKGLPLRPTKIVDLT